MSEAGSTTHQCECAICQAGGDEVTRRYHQQINLLLSRLLSRNVGGMSVCSPPRWIVRVIGSWR